VAARLPQHVGDLALVLTRSMATRNSELPHPFRDGNPALPLPKDNPRDVRAVNTAAAARENGVVTDSLLNTLDYAT
jgi:hypothetical protein